MSGLEKLREQAACMQVADANPGSRDILESP